MNSIYQPNKVESVGVLVPVKSVPRPNEEELVMLVSLPKSPPVKDANEEGSLSPLVKLLKSIPEPFGFVASKLFC